MPKVTIETSVKNDKVDRNRLALYNAIKQFNGKDITITISEAKNKRSNRQNRYYWGVVVKITQNCIFDEWGEWKHDNEVHEFLKYNCNSEEKVNENTGEVIRISRSTTENQTQMQEVFHDKCRKLVFEYFNTVIPLPNEIIKIDFNA